MPDISLMHGRLSDLIWDGMGEADHNEANRLLSDAELLGKVILDLQPNDAQATYAIALSWYHRWPPSDRQNCVEWLQKTEQIDPSFPWAPLYLGYHAFDTGKYEDAYRNFDRVNREFFVSIEHHWRNLKTDELMLVSQMRGNFTSPSIAKLTELVLNYIQADQEDRVFPTEIVNAAIEPKLRNRFEVDSKRVGC